MKIISIICLLFVLSCTDTFSKQETQDSIVNTKLLKPSDVKTLPVSIIKALNSRQCLIPQTPLSNNHINAIKGSFKKIEQKDWAVICVRGDNSSILVFWNGSAKSISEIAPRVETGIKDGTDCWRDIRAVSRKYIIDHYKEYKESGAPKPPPINHQGIEEGYCEKASMIWYWYRGKWRLLQGAD